MSGSNNEPLLLYTEIMYLSGRIKLVELDAQVGRVLSRVYRHADLQGGEGDPLHDGAPEVAEGRDGLDRPLREHVQGKSLQKKNARTSYTPCVPPTTKRIKNR